MAAEYGKAFFLTEFVPYQKATRALARNLADYERVVDVVGEIDAALSIAYLRAHDGDFRDARIDPAAPGLVASNLRHPLVDDAVGNDVKLGPAGLLITGSNMAGKSTLLRTVGVNVVLAQSIGLVAADSWCSRPLHVATAMGAHDDLAAGVSLYRAEVDRIHTLVQRAGGDHLFVLDEAFRGTNPHERIAASAAVLRRLARRDLVVAATHDRELCELLEDCFTLGFFTEAVEGDDVVFDYRLRPGVLQTTNAIALLERAGFPAELVAEARRIAAEH
jgi:DNA mismatch repair ATPase MutS